MGVILWINSGKRFRGRGIVESKFIIICLFSLLTFFVLMEMVEKLQFLNEYGELETVKPGDRAEASAGEAVGESYTGVVSVVYFLAILFMFTGENGLVCCFP